MLFIFTPKVMNILYLPDWGFDILASSHEVAWGTKMFAGVGSLCLEFRIFWYQNQLSRAQNGREIAKNDFLFVCLSVC